MAVLVSEHSQALPGRHASVVLRSGASPLAGPQYSPLMTATNAARRLPPGVVEGSSPQVQSIRRYSLPVQAASSPVLRSAAPAHRAMMPAPHGSPVMGSPVLAPATTMATMGTLTLAPAAPAVMQQRRVSVGPTVFVSSPAMQAVSAMQKIPASKLSNASLVRRAGPGDVDIDLPDSALTASTGGSSSRNSGHGGHGGGHADLAPTKPFQTYQTTPGPGPGTASAPSAALVAAVQLAAASSGTFLPHEEEPPGAMQLSQMQYPQLQPSRQQQQHQQQQEAGGIFFAGQRLEPRRRWASMSEEEMTGGVRRASMDSMDGSSRRPSMDVTGYPSPAMTAAPMVGGWTVVSGGSVPSSAYTDYRDGPGSSGRRRWASISDDEAASPMIWPSRSPLFRSQHVRSRGNTPLVGPCPQPGVSGLPKVSEHGESVAMNVVPSSPFMLPQAQPAQPLTQAQLQAALAAGPRQLPIAEDYTQAAWGWDGSGCVQASGSGYVPSEATWSKDKNGQWRQTVQPQSQQQTVWVMRQPAEQQMMQQTWQTGQTQWQAQAASAGVYAAMPPQQMQQHPGYVAGPVTWVMAPGADGMAQMWPQPDQQSQNQQPEFQDFQDFQDQFQVPVQRTGRGLNGWTVVWIGERAFRAAGSLKEQIESLGFLVKVYRSHDRCSRALEKKGTISSTTVFLLAEADAVPMMEYLKGRNVCGLRVVVDVEAAPETAWALGESLPVLEDGSVTRVCCHWDEVLSTLGEVAAEALYLRGPMPIAVAG
ncbi:unnamed protein product, partial [Polarella glacialis]